MEIGYYPIGILIYLILVWGYIINKCILREYNIY